MRRSPIRHVHWAWRCIQHLAGQREQPLRGVPITGLTSLFGHRDQPVR